MGNKVTVTFEKEVEYCSLCPYGNTFGPVWDPDCEEEVYEVKCSKLNKTVHDFLHWTECASQCKMKTNCLDTPVAECPFNKQTI